MVRETIRKIFMVYAAPGEMNMSRDAQKNEQKTVLKGSSKGVRPAPRPSSRQAPHVTPRLALHASATACWAWDSETGEASFAPEWRNILVFPPARRLGKTLEFLFSRMRRADADLLRKQCRKIAAGEQHSLDIAVRLQRSDNTWGWILLRGKTGLPGAAPGVFHGIGVEVSRLRLDKRFFPPSLDDSQTTYHSLLEHSPHNIVRFDQELFPLYTNPAVATFIPCAPAELGAKKLAEIGTDPVDLEFMQDHVDRVFESGDILKARRPVVTGHGIIIGDFTFWPEFDAEGSVRSVISLQQDVTAEVVREQEAKMNDARFSALFRLTQMDDAPEDELLRFVVETIAELTDSRYAHLHILPDSLGTGGHIVWSESHLALFTEEELAVPDSRLIRSEFGMDVAVQPEPTDQLFENGPVRNPSNLFFRDRLPVTRFLCAPALEDGKTMCLAAVYNKDRKYTEADMRQLQAFISGAWLVLRRRRHLAELTQAKESAELANKVKDRFLANVSHELRTPLNGMLSMMQLLEMTRLSPDQAEYARSAATTGQTLLRIISDILDYSKMESGKLELDNNPFNLKESLIAAVKLFTSEARRKGLDLKLTTIGQFPSMVHGDEARVRQILFNLVGNALKFTETGEIEIFCEARAMSDNLATVHLTVRDTGIGIPLEMQPKVFDAFTQVDGSNTRRHQGSGLGLGIVRLLVKAMGGSVSLTSRPGNGTVVDCVLPFRAVPEELASGTDAPAEAALPVCPSLTVLVAEDDAVSRHAMRLFLQKLGHKPVCVTNGKEALEALRLCRFDCLISDVLMPELDGLEVAEHIRSGKADSFTPSPEVRAMVAQGIPAAEMAPEPLPVPRDIPIVAVSAHAMKGDREHFLACGMDHYLSKPAKIKDLAAVLLRVYERRPSPCAERGGEVAAGD